MLKVIFGDMVCPVKYYTSLPYRSIIENTLTLLGRKCPSKRPDDYRIRVNGRLAIHNEDVIHYDGIPLEMDIELEYHGSKVPIPRWVAASDGKRHDSPKSPSQNNPSLLVNQPPPIPAHMPSHPLPISQPIPPLPVSQPTPPLPVSQPTPPLPVSQPTPPLPVSQPTPPLPVSQPTPPLPVSQPTPPLPVSQPTPPLPVSQPTPPLPVSQPTPPLPVSQPTPPLPVSQPTPPLPVSQPTPPLPVSQPTPPLPVSQPTPPLPVPLELPFNPPSTIQLPQFPSQVSTEEPVSATLSPSIQVSQIPSISFNQSVLDTSTQDPPVNASLSVSPLMGQTNETNFGESDRDLSGSSLTLRSLPSLHSPPSGPSLESHSPDAEPVVVKADSGSSQPTSLLPPVTTSFVNPGSMKPPFTLSYVSVMDSYAGMVPEDPPIPPPFGNSLPQDIPPPPLGNPLPPPSDIPLPQDIPLPPNPLDANPEANLFPPPLSPIANCLHINGVFGETTIEMRPSMTVYNVLAIYINMV